MSINIPNIRIALYDFINEFCDPKVTNECIILGNQNNISLPTETDNYIIFYIQNIIRHGTNIERYQDATESYSMIENNEIVAQIDCYCDSNNGLDDSKAYTMAKSLEIALRSELGTQFLKKYNLCTLYAEDIRNTTITSESNTFLNKYTLICHLAGNFEYNKQIDTFSHVNVGIKDVDVKYK